VEQRASLEGCRLFFMQCVNVITHSCYAIKAIWDKVFRYMYIVSLHAVCTRRFAKVREARSRACCGYDRLSMTDRLAR
jgi:hypothetical protein